MRVAPPLPLTPEERTALERWARGHSTLNRLVLRAKIVLRAAAEAQNKQIPKELGVQATTCALWRHRFHQLRLHGLDRDAPRAGGPPPTPGFHHPGYRARYAPNHTRERDALADPNDGGPLRGQPQYRSPSLASPSDPTSIRRSTPS